MPRRNSPHDIRSLDDLSHLGEWVHDKRAGQRAIAKKNRRNRHYERQFIRHTLAHTAAAGLHGEADGEQDGPRPHTAG